MSSVEIFTILLAAALLGIAEWELIDVHPILGLIVGAVGISLLAGLLASWSS